MYDQSILVIFVFLLSHVNAKNGITCPDPVVEDFNLEPDVTEDQILGTWIPKLTADLTGTGLVRPRTFEIGIKKRRTYSKRSEFIVATNGIFTTTGKCRTTTFILRRVGNPGSPRFMLQEILPVRLPPINLYVLDADCDTIVYYLCDQVETNGTCKRPLFRYMTRKLRKDSQARQSALRVLDNACVNRSDIRVDNPTTGIKACGRLRNEDFQLHKGK